MAPKSLRKTLLGCKTGKRLEKDLHLREIEKRIYSCKFVKINALRKGQLGAYSQEEICLKLSQTEGNSNTVLVNHKKGDFGC